MKKQRSISLNDKEIKKLKKFNKLGRTLKRKIERKINKNLGSNTISLKKYTFKKGECLNRKERRLLVKDKSLLREILKIIKKYFSELNEMISELTDKRNKSYIKYSMKTLIITRLFALICGITTMT